MKKIFPALLLMILFLSGVYAVTNAFADNEHEHTWGEYQFDKISHWCICSECGQEISGSRESHAALCNEINKCTVCGVYSIDGIIISDIVHVGHERDYDKYQHWYKCNECGECYDIHLHWTLCTMPTDKCINCEATTEKGAIIDHLFHEYNSKENTAFDKYSHWCYCKHCGEIIQDTIYSHSSVCTAPDVCQWCGAKTEEGAIIDYISHSSGSHGEPNPNDPYECLIICNGCNEVIYTDEHFSTCTDKKKCYHCGKTERDGIIISFISHVFDYPIFSPIDKNNHSAICPDCGEVVAVISHRFSGEICTECGYKKVEIIPGDSNNDGIADGRDLLRLAKFLAGKDISINETAADMNGDGKLDGRDLLRLAKQLAGS